MLFFFSSPRRTPADLGWRKARKKKTGPSPCCLGPLLLALMSVVPPVMPTLIVLPSGLLLGSTRLLLGTILLLRWLGCWGNLMNKLSSN